MNWFTKLFAPKKVDYIDNLMKESLPYLPKLVDISKGVQPTSVSEEFFQHLVWRLEQREQRFTQALKAHAIATSAPTDAIRVSEAFDWALKG